MENRSVAWSTNYTTTTLSCLDLVRTVDWGDASILSSFIILGIIDILVIGGNTLVIMAVFLHSKLRSVTNLFIVSLAVADLLVGIAVLPFSTCNEVLHFWLFGEIWCKMWLAVDVWLCTASILNLCAISLDRYLAVTRPVSYPSLMSSFKAKILITLVWCISFIICLPPLVGWNDAGALMASEPPTPLASLTNHVASLGDDDEPFQRLLSVNATEISWTNNVSGVDKDREAMRMYTEDGSSRNGSRGGRIGCQCQLISDKGYRIYSALGSFYLPMLVMMFFYWKIYRAAVETTRAINQGFKTTTMGGRFDEQRLTLRIHRGRSSGDFCGAKTNGTCASQQSSFRQKEHHHSPGGDSSSHLTTPPPLPPKPKQGAKCLRTNVKFPPSSKRKICALKNTKRKGDMSDSYRGRRSAQHQWLMVDHEHVGRTVSSPAKESIVETEVCSKGAMDNNGSDKKGASDPQVFPRMGKRNIKAQVKRFRMETKAAKTLGIIVGGFILCWLPFFTIYLVGAFCDEDSIPESLFSVFFWLGYCNSAINPCVYALFSRDFRYAFKKILCRCFLSDEISIKERIVTMFPPTIHLSSFGEESEGGSDSH